MNIGDRVYVADEESAGAITRINCSIEVLLDIDGVVVSCGHHQVAPMDRLTKDDWRIINAALAQRQRRTDQARRKVWQRTERWES